MITEIKLHSKVLTSYNRFNFTSQQTSTISVGHFYSFEPDMKTAKNSNWFPGNWRLF